MRGHPGPALAGPTCKLVPRIHVLLGGKDLDSRLKPRMLTMDGPPMRFPPLKPEDWSDAQRQVAAEIVAGPRGELRGPFVPLIYSPALAAQVQKLGEYLRFGTRLPNDLLELAVLVTARRFGCPNIWHAHRALALEAGLAPAIVAAIAADRRPDPMPDDATIVFDFA